MFICKERRAQAVDAVLGEINIQHQVLIIFRLPNLPVAPFSATRSGVHCCISKEDRIHVNRALVPWHSPWQYSRASESDAIDQQDITYTFAGSNECDTEDELRLPILVES